MITIELDERTAQAIEFAAKMAGVSQGEVVARLVAQSSDVAARAPAAVPDKVAVHTVYEGRRTNATYHPGTRSIKITDGPLAGKTFKSPSGAAIAVVQHYNPRVNANRNGWGFWTITESGHLLQTIRHAA